MGFQSNNEDSYVVLIVLTEHFVDRPLQGRVGRFSGP
jgi:hypothetical protein